MAYYISAISHSAINIINGDPTFRRRGTSTLVALSTHSNPRILKTNRRSPYGQTLSPYDDDDDDDLFSDDEEFSQVEDIGHDLNNSYLNKETCTNQGHGQRKRGHNVRSSKYRERLTGIDTQLDVKNEKIAIHRKGSGDVYHASNRVHTGSPINNRSRGKVTTVTFTKSRFHQLSEDLELDEKWFPLLDYLSTFGLKESHFIQIYERHMSSLQINVTSAQERLEFLLSVGVKHRDIRKIIMRQPQILEYTVENNLKSHVAFLLDLGIPHSRIGHVISAAPSLFSYSVEQSLKPTVRYLVEEVGIKTSDVSKVVQLSPQILVQRLDNSWSTRFGFLSQELGASKDSIVKMVRKHPQLLHYSIEDGILPRINFLRSIGMHNSEVVKVLTGLTQVLSLSLEDNLKPKYLYLVNDLKNEVQSLTKYPTYLSLSLDQRIRPRHRFLVSLKKAPKGPFPLSSFVPTDECFCQQWAKTSLDKYLTFRQNLLLKEFARKYERKG